jgi:hypothetical protein
MARTAEVGQERPIAAGCFRVGYCNIHSRRSMHIEATPRSAAVAGAWAAFGLVPFERWMDHHNVSSVLEGNLLWLAAAALFFLVPIYFLVIGSGAEPFGRTWFLAPDERARYGVIAKRMLIWFLSAGVISAVWSEVLSFI